MYAFTAQPAIEAWNY